ncbi:MAG: hypothetical protein ABI323_00840 [Solirubrobacteraceae bacterium]
MGLLDEAIREHLDLKRRRGADPTEVERAEREALGPVRRAQAPEGPGIDEIEAGAPGVDGEELEHEPGAVDFGHEPGDAGFDHKPGAAAFDHEADGESWHFEPEPAAHEEALDPQPDPVAESPPEAEPVGQETAVHRPDFLDEEPFAEEEPEPRPPLPHSAGGQTAEYDVEHALGSHPGHPAAEDDSDGEELLEETPEFLQDTPDHDRLWFEQRPPKDFDFDG